MDSGGLRKFHCHLRSISIMATMNALSSNAGPWWGKNTIQAKRVNKFVICSKPAGQLIGLAARFERERTIAK